MKKSVLIELEMKLESTEYRSSREKLMILKNSFQKVILGLCSLKQRML